MPLPGQGWVHYDFNVPSASTAPVPPGWSGGWSGNPSAFRPGVDWNDVITSVDRDDLPDGGAEHFRQVVLAIRESCLRFDGDEVYVEVETSNQVFERRDVEVGISDGIHIQVESGLGPEDRIKRG